MTMKTNRERPVLPAPAGMATSCPPQPTVGAGAGQRWAWGPRCRPCTRGQPQPHPARPQDTHSIFSSVGLRTCLEILESSPAFVRRAKKHSPHYGMSASIWNPPPSSTCTPDLGRSVLPVWTFVCLARHVHLLSHPDCKASPEAPHSSSPQFMDKLSPTGALWLALGGSQGQLMAAMGCGH